MIKPPQHSFLPTRRSDTTWSRTRRWKHGEQLAKMAKDVLRHSYKVPVLGYVCSKSYNVNEIQRKIFIITEVFLEFSAKVYSPHHYFENPLKNRTKHLTRELVLLLWATARVLPCFQVRELPDLKSHILHPSAKAGQQAWGKLLKEPRIPYLKG